jgi:hypothetical protein
MIQLSRSAARNLQSFFPSPTLYPVNVPRRALRRIVAREMCAYAAASTTSSHTRSPLIDRLRSLFDLDGEGNQTPERAGNVIGFALRDGRDALEQLRWNPDRNDVRRRKLPSHV